MSKESESLYKNSPKAKKVWEEHKKHRRKKDRKEWYAKNNKEGQ